MRLNNYLTPFTSYNIILLFVFSVAVNGVINISFINLIFYCFLHFTIIYLGMYYYRKSLYLFYFLYGLGLDIFWINEIGPHLMIFMIVLFFFYLVYKYLYNLSSIQIYLILITVQLLMFFLEMILSQVLFNYVFNFELFFRLILMTLIMSYPVFYLFLKLDNLN